MNIFFSSVDWSQFLPSIIATLIGFFLAIVFQQWIYDVVRDKFTNRRKAVEQIHEICGELKEIEDYLIKEDNSKEDNRYYLNPIKTPIWDSIVNTYEIQNVAAYFDARKKKSEINEYKEVLIVYDFIAEYNAWHNFRTIQQNDIEAIKETRDRILDGGIDPRYGKVKSIGEIIQDLTSAVSKR